MIAIHEVKENKGIIQVDHTIIIEIFASFNQNSNSPWNFPPYIRNMCLPIQLIVNVYPKELGGWCFFNDLIIYS